MTEQEIRKEIKDKFGSLAKFAPHFSKYAMEEKIINKPVSSQNLSSAFIYGFARVGKGKNQGTIKPYHIEKALEHYRKPKETPRQILIRYLKNSLNYHSTTGYRFTFKTVDKSDSGIKVVFAPDNTDKDKEELADLCYSIAGDVAENCIAENIKTFNKVCLSQYRGEWDGLIIFDTKGKNEK